MYMCSVLYIYRSAMRCAKFGVVVCKASMVNCRGAICHGYMCIVLYTCDRSTFSGVAQVH